MSDSCLREITAIPDSHVDESLAMLDSRYSADQAMPNYSNQESQAMLDSRYVDPGHT